MKCSVSISNIMRLKSYDFIIKWNAEQSIIYFYSDTKSICIGNGRNSIN